MKTKTLALVSLLLIVGVFSSPLLMPTADGQEISDVKVLILITDGFGWNYFDAREILESWGVNVTTISHSVDTDVPSLMYRLATIKLRGELQRIYFSIQLSSILSISLMRYMFHLVDNGRV